MERVTRQEGVSKEASLMCLLPAMRFLLPPTELPLVLHIPMPAWRPRGTFPSPPPNSGDQCVSTALCPLHSMPRSVAAKADSEVDRITTSAATLPGFASAPSLTE